MTSRGNHRKAIGVAGLWTLFDACAMRGWLLHAYVSMSNDYHLELRTPEAKLVEEVMRWLQGTFGILFIAFRGEHWHVFQSRYRAWI